MRLSFDLDSIPRHTLPVLERPRLASFFSFELPARVAVVIAPAGYGKTVALQAFLCRPRWVHYRVGRGRATFARFVRGFADAVVEHGPGAQASFPRAWERALQAAAPEVVLARWLYEHVRGADVDFAIDDLHEATADPRIAAFLAELVTLCSDRRIAIAARVPGSLPIPLWMATGVMRRPVGASDLCFDAAEIAALSAACGNTGADARQMLDLTGGCAARVAYVADASQAPRSLAAPGHPAAFAALAEQLYRSRAPRERQFLLSAALLPALRPELLAGCGWTDWPTILANLAGDAPHMWELGADDVPRFHDRFADYLDSQLAGAEPSLRLALAQRAVIVLHEQRQYADALGTAIRQRLVDDIGRLLDDRGFAILESGRVDDIAEALAVVSAAGSPPSAVVTALHGYVDARLGRFDTSEAWFARGLESAPSEESRVIIALYYARELMHQFREDAYTVLEPYADSATLPRALLIDVRSSVAQAYMVCGNGRAARARIREALAMLDPATSPALCARVHARAAYVAVNSDDAGAARSHAAYAIPLAIAEGLYDVATSLYSVLYTLAYEVDDDPAVCLAYLAQMQACGARSGTVRVDLYTLVATYELHAEAGNHERLADLDRAISAVDVNYATLAFLESFLPARALQAGWAGDFASAQMLLEPTAQRQATPVRRALRWAEVAMYAAAAGDRSTAYASVEAARRELDEGTERSTHAAFATLHCAVALWTLEEYDRARAWVERCNDDFLPGARRVGAYRSAVACLLAATTDVPAFVQQMPRALVALRESSFGGVANFIESLPLPAGLGADASRPTTLGVWLAQRQLDGLFVAALTSKPAEVALLNWLRKTFEQNAGSRAFGAFATRWTPPPALDVPRARALGLSIRTLLNARAATPAIVAAPRAEVNIDARIDILFAELQTTAPLMAEHSQAVSAWCSRIARRLGLCEQEIAYVTRSGLLHDIGKVTTPASILDAPRRLEAAEWEIMRAHTTEGHRIAAAIPVLAAFIPVIRGHHERLDGKGYPDGLRGGAIPLAARIVTVADCFNAMIGRRAYRLPMSPLNALSELDSNRHTQFDPEVVDAMIGIILGLSTSTLVPSAP